jgi:uncharacterized protein YecT (DUF1311 family)
MRAISAALFFCLAANASAQTFFDYKKVTSSQEYFSGKTQAEIAQTCAAGLGGSMEISFCAKKDFENASSEMQQTLSKRVQVMKANDRSLQSEGFPLALPLFLRSQTLWEQHRDAECYATYRSLGAASGRYAEFWDCMTELTRMRMDYLAQQKGKVQ